MKKFEFLEHTADIKFRAYGKTMEKVFENTALAISSILSRTKKIKSIKKKVISFSISPNNEKLLLYNFIEELVYLLDAENFIICKAKVSIRGDKLSAVIYGDNAKNYKDLNQIKSPTYHEMYVKKMGDCWETQVVVDV